MKKNQREWGEGERVRNMGVKRKFSFQGIEKGRSFVFIIFPCQYDYKLGDSLIFVLPAAPKKRKRKTYQYNARTRETEDAASV